MRHMFARPIRIMLFSALAAVLAHPARPQSATDTKALNAAAIREYVQSSLNAWNIPGAAVGVVKDGQVVFLEGFGKRDVERDLPVTPRTRFILGSTSKAFTTMALGLLADEKKLDWDEPVSSLLPEFRLQDEYASLHVTPRDMASHRTGLPRHDLVWINSPASLGELVHSLRYLEPSRELRAGYQYNNLMFISLGYLIEKISGKTWDSFLRERIFGPLAMSDSGCTIPEYTSAPEYALSYRRTGDKFSPQPFPLPSDRLMFGARASGSVNTTAADMCRWMLVHLNGGKIGDKIFVSTATLRQMHSPQALIPSNPGVRGETVFPSYGLGWMLDVYRGHYRVHHGGSTLDFNSYVTLFPHSNTGAVVLINANTPGINALASGIADLAMGFEPIDWNKRLQEESRRAQGARKPPVRVPGTSPGHRIEDYAGEYRHPAYGLMLVEAAGGSLSVRFHGYASPLEHWNYETFAITQGDVSGIRLTFQTNARGEVAGLSAPLESAVKDIEFERTTRK